MPTLFIGRWLQYSGRFLKSTLSLMATTPEAQRRAHALTIWQKHGIQAAIDSFLVSRSTLYEWRKRLNEGKGKLATLEPKSRRPKNLRIPRTSPWVVEKISTLRTALPYLGKDKMEDILRKQGVPVSASTIGRAIKRHNLPSAPRKYVARKKKRKQKERLPEDFYAKKPGDLVSMDTIVIQEDGERKFIITSLDHASRICIARAYENLSSRKAEDLLRRMQLALGKPIKSVLTDNGSEFHAVYDHACSTLGITHYWTYPRSPKMNARTERLNRTIQEEARFPPFWASIEVWNAYLSHYIMEYNFFRPHQALDYLCPVDQYLKCLTTPSSQSSMLWTHT